MNKTNMRFLSSVLVLFVFGITSAHAVPSVKVLGTNNARAGVNTTAVRAANVQPSNTAQTQRLGNVRAKAVSVGSPVSVTKPVSAPKTADVAETDASRWSSIGKRMQVMNVSSGVNAPITSSSDFINLVDRVSNLETNVEQKQSALTVGQGLVLGNNGLITLNEDMIALPNRVGDLEAEISAKVSALDLETYYYNKEEVDEIVESYIGADVNTIYDSATGKRKYVKIVDTFKEEIFTN